VVEQRRDGGRIYSEIMCGMDKCEVRSDQYVRFRVNYPLQASI
jgi:hypothetical protein